MKTILSFLFVACSLFTNAQSIHSFKVKSIDGGQIDLSKYKGKKIMVVNTASQCGYTPQYASLQKVYSQYKDKLVIIGFPCNQFGSQDPGSNADIANFCQRNYGVTFPMMEKIEVNGSNAHPLYQWLCAEAPGLLGSKAIKWNFTKFLVGRDGRVIKRYAPMDKPENLKADIEAALAQI